LPIIALYLFYSINNWQNILKFFDEFIPKRYSELVRHLIKDIDTLLAAYLRGQISVMLIMAIYYMIGLNIIGLKSATIIGLITGLLVFIPYLGIMTGLLISLAVGFAGFTSMNVIIGILIVFIAGHSLEGALVTPFLVGGKIGLNPIMIIFALMVFGKLFGFIGVLLALPLSTITIVLLRYIKLYYLKSNYYNEES
jgi:predicted PurR-regulated permease PerM